MSQTGKKLFLLDAMALVYRAYYAFSKNHRINSKGMNTSAIFGFVNTLVDLLKSENPTHIAVVFDTPAPTIRHQIFPEYKAQRLEVPEDIIVSLPYIKKLIEGFNIRVISIDGFEADDIIGTLAKKAEIEGFKVFMMTPDKDFGQLVSDNIFIYRPARMGNGAELLGVAEVCEKFGIDRPEQIADLLGLWGDASDNIPGVPGIGEKKAKSLIKEFGSIENLLANLDQVKEKRSLENLQQHAHQAILSKKLATIMIDVPVEARLEDLALAQPDSNALKPLFEELEFRTISKRLLPDTASNNPAVSVSATPGTQMDLFGDSGLAEKEPDIDIVLSRFLQERDYKILGSESEIEELLSQINELNHFCFDTETTGLDQHDLQLVGIAFSTKPGTGRYLPFPANQPEALRLALQIKQVFENPAIEKTGQNLKFDIGVLQQYGIRISGRLFDTMLAHYLLQPDMRHNMDWLARTYLNYTPVSIEALIGPKGKGQLSMREVSVEKVAAYACEDADITLQLRNLFETKLKETGLSDLLFSVETPLIRVISEMERNGVSVDVNVLEEYSRVLDEKISELESEIYRMAGVKFNIGSPKQLGDILFIRLKISDNARKTKTSQFSTSEEILAKLAHRHPIVSQILEYRSLSKLKSTYADALPRLINRKTGRIHTSYNQAVAATGRLSSNNPNLQNIPIRTEEGRYIRQAFVPGGKDFLIMSADYSQIELRIIASMSHDKAMMEAFRSNFDIHTATAARIYETEHAEVTREMRRNAKTVNFGIIYGISAFGLAERLGIPKQEAAQIIKQYFDKYPGIKDYMERTIAFARQNGYVSTLLGRRRYIADINSANAMLRGFAERNAINAPVQGSAADMIKLAMISIHQAMENNRLKSKMIMQVHDELVFEVHREEVETMRTLVQENMKSALPLEVPVEVEINTGKNWLDAH
ncbi:MAG TPA: DNA polymerase I [Bacteroidales bacterium]|nr:DNA polymerase I [Bacteroidales bacterium]